MGTVHYLDCNTTLDIPAERCLNGALKANLMEVVVTGRTEDGELHVYTSSADASKSYWLLELAQKALLDG